MITLTTPRERHNSTAVRMQGFSVDIRHRLVVCYLEIGEINAQGSFVRHESLKAEFKDDSTPSFDDFVVGVPSAPKFRREIESYVASLPDLAGAVD